MHIEPRPAGQPMPHHPPHTPHLRPPKPPGNEGLRSIASTVAILLIAPLIAILLTAFVFQSYQVDGPSMNTTLHNNDRLIVWKLPRTWSKITGHDYTPKRGDIIVFTEARLSEFGQDPSKQLIKRVIGLPGDRVTVHDNAVTVYNAQYPDGFNPDTTLPYHRTAADTAGVLDIVIPQHEIFVLGDNRPNSLDSRSFGPVETKNIVGKLVVRILPLSKAERF
ncbi:MAG: signal peptidase I [Candidatus Saccharimonadales bacterium]